MLTEADLSMSYGTSQFYFAQPFPNLNYSDGVKHVADLGLRWLIDIIASHEFHNKPFQALKKANAALNAFRVWTLDVNTNTKTAIVTCVEDTGKPAAVTQNVSFTDCPLSQVKIYAFTEGDIIRLIMPSEY
jgi:hypothetical protein